MHPPKRLRLDEPQLVDAALRHEKLHPPAAPASLGAGSTAQLRDRMARFSAGDDHRLRRERIDRLIADLSPDRLAEQTKRALAWFLAGTEAPVDAVQLAATVPTVALAAALGWTHVESPGLVADVDLLAAAVGRGEPAGAATDAAVDRLLGRASDHTTDPDSAVSLLYQNADATKAFLLTTLESELEDRPRRPAVVQTVRVAHADVQLNDGPAPRSIAPGATVELNLVVGDREFGLGPHACPGRQLAETITTVVMDELHAIGLLDRWTIRCSEQGEIVLFELG